MKSVSQNEFYEFIKNYDGKLTHNLSSMSEPPVRLYMDDSNNTVARCCVYDNKKDKIGTRKSPNSGYFEGGWCIIEND